MIPQKMKALQLRAINQLELTEMPVPVPGPGEVLIRTRVTTICTSDLHDIRANPFGIRLPNVLGHEAAGIIAACGSGVEGLKPGQHVAAHPVVPCGHCVECRRHFGHLCLNMGHLGIDRQGTFAAYFTQRADRLRVLPETMPFALGTLLEPVANCLQAIARAGDLRNRVVLVVGDGPFGNIIARLAQRAGAARVLVLGKEPFRLGMIPGAEILNEAPQGLADVAILAVSANEALDTCMRALRKRGRLIVFSLLMDPVPVNLFSVHVSELEILGCCNDEDKMDEALTCLKDPALGLEALVTHRIPFENWEEAIDLAANRHDKALKVAMTFS